MEILFEMLKSVFLGQLLMNYRNRHQRADRSIYQRTQALATEQKSKTICNFRRTTNSFKIFSIIRKNGSHRLSITLFCRMFCSSVSSKIHLLLLIRKMNKIFAEFLLLCCLVRISNWRGSCKYFVWISAVFFHGNVSSTSYCNVKRYKIYSEASLREKQNTTKCIESLYTFSIHNQKEIIVH